MKKAFKYLSKLIFFLIILVFALLIFIPYFYKEEIVEMVKDEATNYIEADLKFDDVSISAISSFPELTVGLSDLKLVGKKVFDGVELINVNQLEIKVDLWKVIFNQEYEIKYLSLINPVFQLITLDNGASNYDIYISDSTTEDIEQIEVDQSPFKFKLENYEIKNAQIIYKDDLYHISMLLDSFDHSGELIMHADTFDLNTTTSVKAFNFQFEGLKLMDDVNLEIFFNGAIVFENEDMLFNIRENKISLNDLDLSLNGGIKMKPESYEVDLKIASIGQSFRHFFSLLPIDYQKDFNSIKLDGEFDFGGTINGVYSDKELPLFDINLNIEDGYVKYTDLDPLENINLALNTSFPGGLNYDDLEVNLESMKFSFLSSKFDMSFFGRNFLTDPFITADLSSNLILAELSKVFPLDSIEMSGNSNANIHIKGKYSSIEKEEYDLFEAEGEFTLTDFEFDSQEMDNPLVIDNMHFDIFPQKLGLDKLSLKTGQTDIQLSGEMLNYWPHVLRNEQLYGKFSINSSHLNLDEFIPAYDSLDSSTITDSIHIDSNMLEGYYEVVSIPDNIFFKFESNISSLIYDSIPIREFIGTMTINQGKLSLDQFKMKLFKGQVSLNGTYHSISKKRARLIIDLDIKDISFNESYTYFGTIKKYTPLVKYFDGQFSTFLEADLLLNEYYYPVYTQISSKGKLVSQEFKILSDSPIEKLKSYAPSLIGENEKIKDLNLSYSFTDGKFIMEETPFKLNNHTLSVSGYTSLDQEVRYKIETKIPIRKLQNSNNPLSSLIKEIKLNSNEGEIPITILVNGEIKNPIYSTSIGELNTDLVDKGKEIVTEKIDNVKRDFLDEAQKKADEIISIAKAKAQQIRDEGENKAKLIENEANINKTKADGKTKEEVAKLKEEGYKAADKLIEEAKTPLAKIAAEKTAKKMKEQTDKKANALELRLNTESNKVQNLALQQAKKVREEANLNADIVEKKAAEEANKILDSAKNK